MHLWETNDRNVFEQVNLREFFIPDWKSFLYDREHCNSAFMGILLHHYWSTPSHDCLECDDEQYCKFCKRVGIPKQDNHLLLCFSMDPGYVGLPFLYRIAVDRSQEPEIKEWIDQAYRERGLCLL